MQYLHANRIMHRDLKPENGMLKMSKLAYEKLTTIKEMQIFDFNHPCLYNAYNAPLST